MHIGPPETVLVEPDLIQYQYDGHCPLCHVPLVGCFWVRRDPVDGRGEAGKNRHDREVIEMRLLIAVAAALPLCFGVACQLADQDKPASRRSIVDARMEELKYSQFCTEAADKFWKRHDWAGQQDAHVINSYTFSLQEAFHEESFVDVHGLTLVSAEHKVMESDHIYDALEDTVLGGRVILRKREDRTARSKV